MTEQPRYTRAEYEQMRKEEECTRDGHDPNSNDYRMRVLSGVPLSVSYLCGAYLWTATRTDPE